MEQSTRAWVLDFGTAYGITERLAVHASIPFLHTTFENRDVEDTESSFGDLTIIGRYTWTLFSGVRVSQLSVAAGVNVPMGGGVQNPISSDRNFVSGTLDPIIAASGAVPLSTVISVDASVYARLILTEDDDGSKTGSFLSYSLTGRYKLRRQGVDLSLRLTGLNRAQDEIDGRPFSNSGGDWLFLSPGISWDMSQADAHGLQVWGTVEIPVYQFVNGVQLTEDWTARFGLRYGLDLFGHLGGMGQPPPQHRSSLTPSL